VTIRRGTLLFVAVLTGAGLVGCGGDDEEGARRPRTADLSVEKIVEQTKAAAAAAKSVHAIGDTLDDGTRITVDLRVSEGATTGSMTAEGVTIEILAVGKDTFMRASKDGWTKMTGEAAAGELFGGRWAKIPPNEELFESYRNLADWDFFVEDALTLDGTASKSGTKQIGGVEALGLVDSGDNATLWIPVEGDPLPLQEDAEDGSVLKFREWGEPIMVKPPPAEQVIDLGELAS
jgi:hypothetical protein